MKRIFYFLRLESVFLLFLLGFIIPNSCGAVPLNSNIGSNWSPYRKLSSSKGGISREATVSDPSSGSHSQTQQPSPVFSSSAYSTLPQNIPESGLRTVNSFGVDPNGNGFMSGSSDQSGNYFNYQLANSPGDVGSFQQQGQGQEQQFQAFSPGQFPDFGEGFQNGQQDFGGFDDSENGIEESSGILGIMSTIFERFGITNMFARMREMISNFMEQTQLSNIFSNAGSMVMSMVALPMMLPMAAVIPAMGLAGLMAFPILQLTIPGIRRSFSDTATLTRDVLKSEECVERISCNLARAAKKIPYEGWISSKLEKSENKWLTRVSKSLKAARTSGEECSQFTCSHVTRVQKMIRSYLLGEKEKSGEKKSS